MIPHMNIVAWSNVAPWASFQQVEQDLIISRAVIDIFNDDFLRKELRFRGGTALNKLHFPNPLRYSEDIDLVRTSAGPIKALLGQIRDVLRPWLGEAAFRDSPVAPTLTYRADAEDGGPQLRLKVEINTREREAYDGAVLKPHEIENPWFAGQADIPTFTNEEMLATKLRALLERNKGRDLFDLAHALGVFDGLDTDRVLALFAQYMEAQGKSLTRAQAEQRMLNKLVHADFLADIRPLLAADAAAALTDDKVNASFMDVFTRLIARFPGEPWALTEKRLTHYRLV
jgi:predicted nucleotidyltransferase component of viral defense system